MFVSNVQQRLDRAEGAAVSLFRIQPVVVECGCKKDDTKFLRALPRLAKTVFVDDPPAQKMQSRGDRSRAVAMPDQADPRVLWKRRDELRQINPIECAAASQQADARQRYAPRPGARPSGSGAMPPLEARTSRTSSRLGRLLRQTTQVRSGTWRLRVSALAPLTDVLSFFAPSLGAVAGRRTARRRAC